MAVERRLNVSSIRVRTGASTVEREREGERVRRKERYVCRYIEREWV